jgi:DNA-binding NarL/FixJ family response regulator
MDVRMPPTHTTEGLRAAVELKAAVPEVGVLILSQHVESRHAIELLAHSAAGVGYLLKERIARPAELDEAVRRIAAGGTAIDPEVVSAVLGTRRTSDPLSALTTREREVLTLVAEGQSNDAVAEHLLVNTRTVETHMANILTKLGLPAEPGTHRRVLAVLTYLRMQASEAEHRDSTG